MRGLTAFNTVVRREAGVEASSTGSFARLAAFNTVVRSKAGVKASSTGFLPKPRRKEKTAASRRTTAGSKDARKTAASRRTTAGSRDASRELPRVDAQLLAEDLGRLNDARNRRR